MCMPKEIRTCPEIIYSLNMLIKITYFIIKKCNSKTLRWKFTPHMVPVLWSKICSPFLRASPIIYIHKSLFNQSYYFKCPRNTLEINHQSSFIFTNDFYCGLFCIQVVEDNIHIFQFASDSWQWSGRIIVIASNINCQHTPYSGEIRNIMSVQKDVM